MLKQLVNEKTLVNSAAVLENLNNESLLENCKSAVQREKQSTSCVLEYLSEIDKRRLWLKEGYSSLFDFCVRYLNYSEGESYRRIQACRLTNKVHEVKPLLEDGTLSLTVMSLLSPVLTKENAKEILPQVANRSSREVEKVIQTHFPERTHKEETLTIKIDSELKGLLEQATLLASEKDPVSLLKKVLKAYIREKRPRAASVKSHTRYVQVPIAREVKKDSGYQCSYTSEKGIRCNQRAHLQIDHIRPWAKGGSSRDRDNLRCLCRAHNLFFAKRDFPNRQYS